MTKTTQIKQLNKQLLPFRILYITSILLYVVFFVVAYLLFDQTDGGIVIILVFPMMALIIGHVFVYHKMKQLVEQFKTKYFPSIIRSYIPNSNYHADGGLKQKEINAAEIFPYYDRYDVNDFISGTYKNVHFRSSDVILIQIIKGSKYNTEETIFKGRMYIFDFPKAFRSNLVLVQKKDLWGDWRPGNLQTESILANSEFRFFAVDEHEAFYLLTPHLIEKLLYLDDKYNDQIMISFNHNKLYVIDYSKTSMIDFNPMKKISEKFFDNSFQKVKDIMELVDVLQLDTTIFKP